MRIDKYAACDNSFLIVMFNDEEDYNFLAKTMCSKYDVDGLLVFRNDPIEMLVFNKDGSEAFMCGNGIRCLCHYLYDRFKIYKHLLVKTKSGNYECEIINTEPFISSVRLGLGEYVEGIFKETIRIKEKEFLITGFELGVKHLMVLSDDFKEDIDHIEQIFEYPLFEKEFNISLVNPLSHEVFEIITYERGVGFTNSCGTAAASCAYILHEEYNMDSNLIAISPGGVLKIDIEDEIILKGESVYIESFEV